MQTPTRNLLIVQTANLQDPSDWIAIKQRIELDAPDIEVRITNNEHSDPTTMRWQVQRPSLVFSPVHLINYAPRGGAVFCGRILGKDEQLRRLSSIGILAPRTATLSSVCSFDPKEWGDYVIVKPNNLNLGAGVTLVRTIDLSARYEELADLSSMAIVRNSDMNRTLGPAAPRDQVGRSISPEVLLVQPFIDHSEDGYPTEYRVLSLFGRALYCSRNRWGNKRPPLSEIATDPRGLIASNSSMMGGRIRSICNDAEIISLGERAHEAFPECPVLGVDIIRDNKNGRLYVLEVNPHGAVWHLSSSFAKTMDQKHTRELYAQFNALDRAANLLIKKLAPMVAEGSNPNHNRRAKRPAVGSFSLPKHTVPRSDSDAVDSSSTAM